MRHRKSITFAIVGSLLIMFPVNYIINLPGIITLVGDISTSARQTLNIIGNTMVIAGSILMSMFFYNNFIKGQEHLSIKTSGLTGVMGFMAYIFTNILNIIINTYFSFFLKNPANYRMNMNFFVTLNTSAKVISLVGIILIIISFSLYYRVFKKGLAMRRIVLLIIVSEYIALAALLGGHIFFRYVLPELDIAVWGNRLSLISNILYIVGIVPFFFIIIYLRKLYGYVLEDKESSSLSREI